jgi:hypothetical protein
MMPLVTLLFMLLGALALTKMWADSEIFRPVRNKMADYKWLHKPWLCSKCMSFWMGGLAAVIIGDPFHQLGVMIGVSTVLCGLVSHLITCILVDKEIF